MARSIVNVPFNGDVAAISQSIWQVLQSNGYAVAKYYEEENVWSKGDGLVLMKTFIKVEFPPNQIVISAWTSKGLDGGKEGDLKGFTGIVFKKQCQKVVDNIAAMVKANG